MAAEVNTKNCSKCHEAKKIDCFSLDSTKKDGYYSSCKDCNKGAFKNWPSHNNKELLAQRTRECKSRHPDRYRQRKQRWRDNNKAIVNSKEREKYYVRREDYLAKNSKWRALKKGSEGSHTGEEIERLYLYQNGKCAVCKVQLNGKYQKDHIVALTKGGSDYIDNIQLLCQHCNATKHTKDPIEFMQSIGYLL